MDDEELKKDKPSILQPIRQARVGATAPKGTGFTNIQSIIKANQGNRLGSAVAGGVQNTANQARSNVQVAGQKFGQAVQANKFGEQDQAAATGLINKALGTSTQPAAPRSELVAASPPPAPQTLSEQDLTAAEKYRQGAYQGPQDVENAAQLVGQAQEAEDLGRLSGSSAGRQGLLQRFVGAPQYSFGQQKLDNLLLGADQGALRQARAATRGVSDQAVSAIEAARGQAQEAAGSNQRFGKLFGEQAVGAQKGITDTRNAALAAARVSDKNAADQYAAFRRNLLNYYNPSTSGGMRTGEVQDPETLINNYQGLSPEIKQQLLAIDRGRQLESGGSINSIINPLAAVSNVLGDYQNAQGLDETRFTSKQQAAQLNALAKLAGKNEQDFSQAGTSTTGKAGINTEAALRGKESVDLAKDYRRQYGQSLERSKGADFATVKKENELRKQLNDKLIALRDSINTRGY
tara:strand:+ start:4977 stop:6365 length:1389 start_codon:yes stop_codon:yes gene_type:complete